MARLWKKENLPQRLAPFVARGMIPRVPTNWQNTQGSLELVLYVIAPKRGDQERYAGTLLGRWWIRWLPLIAYTVLAYFRVGSGIRAKERSQRKHLLAVHHPEMPVYDLQLIQSFPNGLENLRRRFIEVRDRKTFLRRLERWFVGLIIPDWDVYCERMLGYIAAAERFDYEPPPSWWARSEHWSFVEFMNYCATAFPASSKEERFFPMVRRLCQLFFRRIRGYASDYRSPVSNPKQFAS